MTAQAHHTQDMRGSRKFGRGGPNLITFFLVGEGIKDPNNAINGPSSARQRNGVSLAGR